MRALTWMLLYVLAGTVNAGDDSLEEVVVTARKLPEALDSVPLAIQVISRQEIQRSGIDGLVSLAAHAEHGAIS